MSKARNLRQLAAHTGIAAPRASRYVVDGVFFQFGRTGIARVWENVLAEWVKSGFAREVTVLDRAGTAPRLKGVRYRMVAPYFFSLIDADRQMLQRVCDELGAHFFLSTYYTTPLTTPSIFLCHDMIPEVMGWDLANPQWREKHRAIVQASAWAAVSHNTARDLSRFFPAIPLESIAVAHNGVSPFFSPVETVQIEQFRVRRGIGKPYFLLVGAGGGEYKNARLFFAACERLGTPLPFEIVCIGQKKAVESQFGTCTQGGAPIHALQPDDDELRTAYTGALALVYPSKYEGFGLPVLEAMACGCPVIACRCASIPEVAGEAALYIDPDDADALARALVEMQSPELRHRLSAAGLEQAKCFPWTKTACVLKEVLVRTAIAARPARRKPDLAPAPYSPLAREQVQQALLQARQFFQAGNLKGATGVYYQILERFPENLEAIHGLALVFWKLGGGDAARQMLIHVTERQPDLAEAHHQLGQMFEEIGRAEEAADYYRRAESRR